MFQASKILAVYFIALSVSWFYIRSSYSSREIMPVLYPVLAALMLGVAVLTSLSTWFVGKGGYPQGLIFLNASYFLFDSVVTGLLGVVTGPSPKYDIDLIRPYIVDVRFALFGICIPICVLRFRRITGW